MVSDLKKLATNFSTLLSTPLDASKVASKAKNKPDQNRKDTPKE